MADVERSIRQVLDSIEKDKKIPKENKSALENHINFLRARGADPKTVLKHLYCMKKFLPALGGVDCREADRQDIERAMAKIEALSIGSETKRNVKSIIKAFYKHMLGEDLYYPKQVAWIKTSQAKNKRTLPEGILTEDDILKMLTASGNVRDKAIVALLFDSGIRVGELLGVRVKDVDLDSEPAHVTVNGKTGMRRIPILFSVPYLAGYLNTIRDRKQPEPLFMAIGSWSNLERPVERAAVAKVLKLAAKRSHIDKPINPHAFRHARATYYASRLTEQQLKAFFGWTGDSRMASTYVHLSGRDIDNAVMKAYGVAKSEEESRPKLTVIRCPKCREGNAMDSQYCARCGSPLMPKLNVEHGEKEDLLRKAMVKALDSDPKLMEELIHQYLEGKRKSGRNGK